VPDSDDHGAAADEATQILAAIERRFGFVPPFYGPAAQQPALLANLWQQTQTAYVDNPLPTLFKEQLAASLGRFCAARYCLICHTCSLRPLGADAPAILELLRQPVPTIAEVEATIARLADRSRAADLHGQDSEFTAGVMQLAIGVYLGGAMTQQALPALARLLDPHTYNDLISFISYNRMCHEWVLAHPEVSFQTDQRYLQNYDEMIAAAPALHELLSGTITPASSQDANTIAEHRLAEFEDVAKIAERRLQDVLGSLNARLTAALDDAAERGPVERELRATAQFAQELVAIVSHDLRNPLGAILNGAQLLQMSRALEPPAVRAVDRIISSARRSIRLIADLLDYSQARLGGGIPIDCQSTDLQVLIRTLADEFELSHPGRTLRIVHTGTSEGSWDADRIGQVLSNLLSNALTHSPDDSEVVVSSHGEADTMVLTIANSNRGAPISSELLPVLFEPFKRGVSPVSNRRKSVGLGLYIVEQIVRAHGGTLAAYSDVDGTRFIVRLQRKASRCAPVHTV